MAKCSECGKFMTSISGVRCCRCAAPFHKKCMSVAEGEAAAATWVCPNCKAITPETQLNLSIASSSSSLAMASPVGSLPDPGVTSASVDFAALVAQIGSVRNEISALRTEVREYRNEIADFKAQLRSHGENIVTVENRVSSLEEKFEKMVPCNTEPIESTIMELRSQLNERDQELLLNDVEISGIPESKEESVAHVVKVLTIKLGVEIEERDIIHAERVGSTRRNIIEAAGGGKEAFTAADPATQRPRCVSVRFARRATRNQILHAARVRRNLTSHDLEMRGEASRVYVNERLTRVNRQLFYQARQAASRSNWRFVWTRDGKILARKADGLKAERIRCPKDIDRIFG